MEQRIIVMVIMLTVTSLVMCGMSATETGSAQLPEEIVQIQEDDYTQADEPNGTLLVDGVTLRFEGEEIRQTGSIMVTNGGTLIIRDTDFQFLQLAPNQYRITVEESSAVLIENSAFTAKYPVSWYVSSSNVTLLDSSVTQCFLSLRDASTLMANESLVSGVRITDECVLTATGSVLGDINMNSGTVATVLNTNAGSIHLSESAFLDADYLTCSEIILSDDSSCVLTSPDCDVLHLWEQAEASVTGGLAQDIGLYDSTSIVVSDCSVGYFVIRSSLSQTLDSLSIDELLCIHYSQVQVTNCDIGILTATNHATLSIMNCNLGDVLLTEWCSGEMSHTNASSAIVTMYASWNLTGIDSEYLECSREALVRVLDSSIYTLYAWSFNLTTWSYANLLSISNSNMSTLRAGWWTMPVLNNCIVDYGALYDHLILDISHTNFTTELRLLSDLSGNFSFCNVSLLLTRQTVNVTFRSSTIGWQVEPDFVTERVSNLPLGYVSFWNPLTNGSFGTVTYSLTLVDCVMDNLRIIIGREVSCSVYNSTFSYAEVASPGYGEFVGCNITQFIGNGDVNISRCIIGEMIGRYSSQGHLEDSQFETTNVYATADYTAVGCTFSHAQVGGWDGAILRLEDCNSTSFWASGTGTAELQGCYIWQIRTYNYIHIAATDCVIDIWYNAYVDYPVASATNCTLGTITAIAHTTLTMVDCDVEYFGTGDYATTVAENCSFYQFSASNWAQVTLRGDFSWTHSFTVGNDAIVYRDFTIRVVFSNGTSCSTTEYAVLSTLNVTLHTGTTSLLGTDQFTLSFTQSNIAEFHDEYTVSVDTLLLQGWYAFNVSSSQPLEVLVEEKPVPPQPEGNTTPEETEPPTGHQHEPVFTLARGSIVVLGFVAGSCVCVSAVIIVQHSLPFRTTSFGRTRNEET